MQAWDYKLLEVTQDAAGLVAKWVWEEDGQQLSGQPQELAKVKQLGAQGWEMVSMSSTGDGSRFTYWFKRPK